MLAGCSTQDKRQSDPQSRRVEERAIYALLTESQCADHSPVPGWFILDQTNPAKYIFDPDYTYLAYWRGELKSVSQAALDDIANDFKTANTEDYHLSELLDSGCKFLSQEEFKKNFDAASQKDWDVIHATYPNIFGYLIFSRIGFNSEMNQALVYTAQYCGFTCGLGNLIFLVKEGDTWRIEKDVNLWVS